MNGTAMMNIELYGSERHELVKNGVWMGIGMEWKRSEFPEV